MEIDESIKSETKHCLKNFECLNAVNFRLLNGKVKRVYNGTIYVVNCSEMVCCYKMSFGKYIICNCPTRQEVHKKITTNDCLTTSS